MKKLNFKLNYNRKLNNRFFTTIRLSKNYYQAGEKVEVYLRDKYIYPAQIINIKLCSLSELPQMTACIDTGMSLPESIKLIKSIYPGTDWNTEKLSIILCENLDWEEPIDPDTIVYQPFKKANA
jgi:hypothetical protein